MTGAAAEAILFRVLSTLYSILGLVTGLSSALAPVAHEHSEYNIEGIVTQTSLNIISPAHGLPFILDKVQALKDDLDASVASLTLQIENLTDGTTPVSLPSAPPSGYGGVASGDIGEAVWGWFGVGGYARMDTELMMAGGQGFRLTQMAANADLSDYFRPFNYYYSDQPSWTATPAVFNLGDLVATETLLACLTRQNPTATVAEYDGVGGHVRVSFGFGNPIHDWVSTIDETQYQAIVRTLLGSPVQAVPSIWPGLAAVTLGGTIALDRATALVEPLDGVIITLTATPPDKPHYTLGGVTATAHIGQVAFLADNGAAEYPQNLSFASEIYVPHAMARAASCVIRTVIGVEGTVQAWTKNP